MSSIRTSFRARPLTPNNHASCADRMVLVLAALLLFLVPTLPAQASVVTVGDARFPTFMQSSDGKILELKGTGLARYAVVIRVYGAGLYGPEGVPAARLLEQGEPKRLEIEYFVDIEASDLTLAANTILEKQLAADALQALAPRIRQIHDAYRSVTPGDRYVMEYLPGEGTRLSLNGKTLVIVEGSDFARAYFGIWLGEEPLSLNLRNALLGR
ncbi:MAG: chalcone isomerase family protein [Thioalkalivibrio sp.]